MRSSDAGTPTCPPSKAWNSGRKYVREWLFVPLAGVSIDVRPPEPDFAGPDGRHVSVALLPDGRPILAEPHRSPRFVTLRGHRGSKQT